MAVEYLGLSAINGPLVVLEGVRGASYERSWDVLLRFTRTKPSSRYLKVQKEWLSGTHTHV